MKTGNAFIPCFVKLNGGFGNVISKVINSTLIKNNISMNNTLRMTSQRLVIIDELGNAKKYNTIDTFYTQAV